MSRTHHEFRGVLSPAKTKCKPKDKKFFGFTSGTHSGFKEPVWASDADRNQYLTEVSTFTSTTVERETKTKTYPEKGVDFVKYGYGNSTKKEKRVKNYQREIE